MTVFLALLLTVVAFTCATYPLLRKKATISAHTAGDEDLEELLSRRDTTYSMLKELEFDYQSGILSKDDYDELRSCYKRKAVAILKDMDGTQQHDNVDDEIERKVLALRRGVGALPSDKGAGDKAVDEIEKGVLALRQRRGRFCRQCGAQHEPEDHFCAHCGTKLFKEEQP